MHSITYSCHNYASQVIKVDILCRSNSSHYKIYKKLPKWSCNKTDLNSLSILKTLRRSPYNCASKIQQHCLCSWYTSEQLTNRCSDMWDRKPVGNSFLSVFLIQLVSRSIKITTVFLLCVSLGQLHCGYKTANISLTLPLHTSLWSM